MTVIATGFDHVAARSPRGPGAATAPRRGATRARSAPPPPPRDRGPRYDDRQRSSLEIADDEIEIPRFLR